MKHAPGSIVNGYYLASDNQWYPVAQMPRRKKWYDSGRGLAALIAGSILVPLALVGAAAIPGSSKTTTAASIPNPSSSPAAPAPKSTQVPKTTLAPKRSVAPVPRTYPEVDSRQWAMIVKNPDAYTGQSFTVYGNVTQFDAATGTSGFRADGASYDKTEYGYFMGDNAIWAGNPSTLANIVKGDTFRAQVVVLGSESYATQIGGSTTVPKFSVVSIDVIGRTGN